MGAGSSACWSRRRRFDPRHDPKNLLWWSARLGVSHTGGLVDTWTDQIAGKVLSGSGSTRPTYSATGMAGSYAGITGDGGDVVTCASPDLTGLSAITLVATMHDAAATASMICMHLSTAGGTGDGTAYLYLNFGSSPRVQGWARGTVNSTDRARESETLATRRVISVGYDYATAGANAVPFIRVNGVGAALNTLTSASAAGTAAAGPLALFNSVTPGTGWSGTFTDVVFRSGVALDDGLDRLERYAGAQIGLAW